jgi:hypothetical protein
MDETSQVTIFNRVMKILKKMENTVFPKTLDASQASLVV